jgi:PIN domain nuclease of toxin-antitoxin system
MVLLDTHLLLWAAVRPDLAGRSPDVVRSGNELFFTAARVWEVAIRRGLGRRDFQVDPGLLRRGLLENGYGELTITSDHTITVGVLPPIHRDPFDRLLVAQASLRRSRCLPPTPL